MKVIGFLGGLLLGIGLIWGIFFRGLLTAAALGIIMMVLMMIFDEEE